MTEEISGPIVFQCKKCHVILGDSFSLTCTDQQLNMITLKSVIHVTISEELQTSASGPDRGSTFNSLQCESCKSVIGKMYLTTSRQLDQHRDLFSFSIDTVDAYVLGSAPITTRDDVPLKPYPNVAIFGYDADRALSILDTMRKMEQIILHQNDRLNELEEKLKSKNNTPSS
ncbi:hypothetical protein WA158_008143 [Blastocystis sp. Blastoise]